MGRYARLFAVAVLLLFVSTGGGDAQPASPLHLLVSSYGFMPPAFIAAPSSPATDLLLVGEAPVFRFQVRVVNSGASPRVLNAPRRTLNVIVRTFPGGQPIDVPEPTVSGPVRVSSTGTGATAVNWDEQVPLAPREYLEWTVEVQLQSVLPGVYRFEAVLPASDDTGKDIARFAQAVYLEIRNDQSEQATTEMGVRAALGFIHERRLADALQVATDAAMRSPNSVLLHAIVGDIYERLGQRAEASRSYSRALAVLESGQEYPVPFRSDALERIFVLRSRIAQLN